TTMMSEAGAEIALTEVDPALLTPQTPLALHVLEQSLAVQAQVVHLQQREDDLPLLRVEFLPLAVEQQRSLVELLYCRPGQWRSRCAPGELQSIWLLIKVLLQPEVLVNRRGKIRPIEIVKGWRQSLNFSLKLFKVTQA
ncbi:PilZ domain-containing protein, partial [Baaleninema sp.]|uniref:PilZ domain-containing protein n=1 Tax=Baaleninema sp. TaxID=3101197 RepID=UPI003D04BCC2